MCVFVCNCLRARVCAGEALANSILGPEKVAKIRAALVSVFLKVDTYTQ